MNDFGISILGLVGVVKPKSFGLAAKADILNRSFKIESGPGCEPTLGTLRKIKGHWLCDKMHDSISSYDFEWVIDKDGKKVERLPEEQSDVEPVRLASERAPTAEAHKTVQVRRKR